MRGPGIGYYGPVICPETAYVRFDVVFAPQAASADVAACVMQGGRLLIVHQGVVGNYADPVRGTVAGGCSVSLTILALAAAEYEAVLVTTAPVNVSIAATAVAF